MKTSLQYCGARSVFFLSNKNEQKMEDYDDFERQLKENKGDLQTKFCHIFICR